jgi:hypothetical protein
MITHPTERNKQGFLQGRHGVIRTISGPTYDTGDPVFEAPVRTGRIPVCGAAEILVPGWRAIWR